MREAKSHDNFWQSPRKLQFVSSVGWISVDLNVIFVSFCFVCLFPTYKTWRVSYLSYFTVLPFHCPGKSPWRSNSSCETCHQKLRREQYSTEKYSEFQGRIFKCSDMAAVYSTPLSFTRHRSGSRVWRIHETLVIGTATRKKLSRVMRPTLLKPNSKLNRSPDWNEICKDLLVFVKNCCIQDSGSKYALRLFGLRCV